MSTVWELYPTDKLLTWHGAQAYAQTVGATWELPTPEQLKLERQHVVFKYKEYWCRDDKLQTVQPVVNVESGRVDYYRLSHLGFHVHCVQKVRKSNASYYTSRDYRELYNNVTTQSTPLLCFLNHVGAGGVLCRDVCKVSSNKYGVRAGVRGTLYFEFSWGELNEENFVKVCESTSLEWLPFTRNNLLPSYVEDRSHELQFVDEVDND